MPNALLMAQAFNALADLEKDYSTSYAKATVLGRSPAKLLEMSKKHRLVGDALVALVVEDLRSRHAAQAGQAAA